MNKRSKIIIASIAIILIIVLGYISQLDDIVIQVDAADNFCEIDDDCVGVSTHCSGCSCGALVNKIHQKKYIDQYAATCQFFGGTQQCKPQCPQLIKCLDNKCIRTGDIVRTE